MIVRPFAIAALLWMLQPSFAAASEPAVKGSFHTILMLGDYCVSAPQTAESYLRPGKRLELRACRNSPEQHFEWNVVTFEIKFEGLCVDAFRADAGPSQPGDPVGLWYCQDTGHQKWFPDNKNAKWPGAFNIVGGGSPSGNLCLTSDDSKGSDGAQIAIQNCNNADTQWYRLHEWPPLKGAPVSQREELMPLLAAIAAQRKQPDKPDATGR